MYCPTCGSLMSDGPTSCPYCGAPVTPPEKGPVEKYLYEPVTRPEGKPKAEPAEKPAFRSAPESKAEPHYSQSAAGQPQKQSNGAAVAGFIFSILAFVTSVIMGIGFILGLPAFILSIAGISKSKKKNAVNKGLATAGLILSIIAILINIFYSTISIKIGVEKYLEKAHEASISVSYHYDNHPTDEG